jgi:hypothetical protein
MIPPRRAQLAAIFVTLALLVIVVAMTSRCSRGMGALITVMDAPRDASFPAPGPVPEPVP